MLKMSFYDGTLDKDKLRQFIKETDKEVRYTHGLGYRKPRIHRKLISKEEAYIIVGKESLLDAREMDDYLHLNSYSGSDMF